MYILYYLLLLRFPIFHINIYLKNFPGIYPPPPLPTPVGIQIEHIHPTKVPAPRHHNSKNAIDTKFFIISISPARRIEKMYILGVKKGGWGI